MKSPAWHSLRPSAWLAASALVFLGQLGSAPLARAADKTPATSETKGKAASGKAKAKGKGKAGSVATPGDAAQEGLGSMGDMIPEGMRNLKVRIPGFDQGKQTSLITADAVTKQAKDALFAEHMAIHMYADKPEENVRVDLITATYDMGSKVLTSQERSRVSRSDFQLEGDSMVFDTTTSSGKMVGRVQMVIYGTANLKPEPVTPTPVPPPAPDTSFIPPGAASTKAKP